MEFDKTRRSCPWNSDQNCTKNSARGRRGCGVGEGAIQRYSQSHSLTVQWRIQDFPNGGGRCFVTNGGAHILFSGKKCMKLKEIGLKWGGACLLAPCYSKITIFL